jgi:hypothetical protein
LIQNLTSKIQNLQQHSGFIKYFKNTSWLFGEKILRMIVGLFVGICTTFTILGFDGKVVRELFIKNIRKNYD